MNLLDLCFEREQQERKERTMNRTRREAIDDLIEQLENIQQQNKKMLKIEIVDAINSILIYKYIFIDLQMN